MSSFGHLWIWRGRPVAGAVQVPGPWQLYLRGLGVALVAYGVAMLVAPEPVTAFWPWTVDAFHRRMYAATFLAFGVGAWLVSRRAARVEH